MKKNLIMCLILAGLQFILILVQPSCMPCNNDPVKLYTRALKGEKYRIDGIEQDNGIEYFQIVAPADDAEGISFDELAIEIHNDYYAFCPNPLKSSYGLSSAFACSPNEYYSIVNKIEITSSEDYNEEYPKGTDLKGIMRVRQGLYIEGHEVEAYMNNMELYSSLFLYNFIAPPSEDKVHDLTFKYFLYEGGEVETTVSGVLITKQ